MGLEIYAKIQPSPNGNWNNTVNNDSSFGEEPNVSFGIAELELNSVITISGTPTEGAGVFTTSINLSAGNETTGNLAEGSQVYWQVSGITADDLAFGTLSGSGVINNGKLDIQHSLRSDPDSGESFDVAVFSDTAYTQQIGTTSSVGIQVLNSVPIILSNSLYTIVNGPSWTDAQDSAEAIGGNLYSLNSEEEARFI